MAGHQSPGYCPILPYLAFRQPNPKFAAEKDLVLNLFDSRLLGIFLSILTAILLGYGLVNGDWVDFSQQWQTNSFIHIMSLDFCLLGLLFPTVLKDDLARRGIDGNLVFWLVTLIPLLGPLAYLCWRPQLREELSSGEPKFIGEEST